MLSSMTRKLTEQVENARATHAAAMRIIADLHAAYGSGVELTIDATTGKATWLYLSSPRGAFAASFYDDGTVFDSTDVRSMAMRGPRGHLDVLEDVRTFLHQFGQGRR